MTALVRVGTGNHPAGSITPAWSWFNPLQGGFTGFVTGIILMLFIYWGWDTAVAVNEETKDPAKTPGRAAILSTVILLVTYVARDPGGAVVRRHRHARASGSATATTPVDVLSVLGNAVFGGTGIGLFLARLLLLMVLTSAAASTQTTILPTARTTLSMATYKALPQVVRQDAPALPDAHRVHDRDGCHLGAALPRRSTTSRGGFVIADAVTAIGLYIAFYYGLTGFACAWYYRKTLRAEPAEPVDAGHPARPRRPDHVRGGRLVDLGRLGRGDSENSYTSWLMPFWPHWYIGGVFVIAFLSGLAGLIAGIWIRFAMPAFFRKETLTRATPTLVPDECQQAANRKAPGPPRGGPGGCLSAGHGYRLSSTALRMPGVLADGSACRQTSSITCR